MPDKPKTCINCIWLSSGWQDARGAGWCHAEMDYVEADGTCACWQASLREVPLNLDPGEPGEE